MSKRIFAVSDAHIGGLHFQIRRAQDIIAAGIANCDEAVLVGDIFEAKSKTLSQNLRLGMCREAIDQWAKAKPGARIHIILGNHECPIRKKSEDFAYCDAFMEKLKNYAAQYPNIIFHPTPHLQLGDMLFIHGHHEAERYKPWLLDVAESIACNVITPVAKWLKPPQHFIDAIDSYIRKKALPGVRHVCFGHIHQRFMHQLPKGKDSPEFHNLGTFYSVFRDDANPLMIIQNDDGLTQSIERFCIS